MLAVPNTTLSLSATLLKNVRGIVNGIFLRSTPFFHKPFLELLENRKSKQSDPKLRILRLKLYVDFVIQIHPTFSILINHTQKMYEGFLP